MNPVTCTICETTNYMPETQAFLVATFPSFSQAKQALFFMQKAHIIPVWSTIYAKDEVALKTNNLFDGADTLVIQLHGIKDIVRLQLLYGESMCQQNNCLTFDVFATKLQCEKLMEKLG